MIKSLRRCREFRAGDGSILREILHPDKARLKLRYSLAHAKVFRKQKTRPHRLRTTEVYHILKGTGRMCIDSKTNCVRAGDTVYIPPESIQWIENTGRRTLEFLCVVDPAWRAEDEEILD